MISMAFDYSRATSVDDALGKLKAADGAAKLIAGGHSLIPLMKLRLSEPGVLIDIARIPGLSGIRQQGDRIQHGQSRCGGCRVAELGFCHHQSGGVQLEL